MNDRMIVQLFWERSEQALSESRAKYGAYCQFIARGILTSLQDAEEVVQDTWLAAWNSIPPNCPENLKTYLGKLARRSALKKYRNTHAQKRGGGEVPLVLEELQECLPARHGTEDAVDGRRLSEAVDRFLQGLREEERSMFICRYWYMDALDAISAHFGFSLSKVKSTLFRLRRRLYRHLEREGFFDEE